ncbi:acyl-CoA N-acyltransferase [Thelephora terrestris]|uniref:Acyl-CoA N-acyltransferase n=1 Tax=Thelephora terrestris TaxID=56493 RepID=A0A9P6HMF1_9AGAM|nr:acyl-CoA N-acyltransferase [Thelephora terrestris]
MAPVSAPDHEIIVVTPEMNELRQQCYDIRIAVFVSEQGFSVDEEFDQWDEDATHLLLRLVPSLKPVGTVRPIRAPNYYKLGRLAVLKEYRQFSFGKALLLGVHDWVRADAIKNGCNGEVKIRAHSQLPVRGFYAKYGYISEGDEFDEDGALHQLMIATIKLD